VGVWKSTEGQRFQNYKALFTVLRIGKIARAWLDDLFAGNPITNNCPSEWRLWVNTGQYTPLEAQPNINIRTVDDQLPQTFIEKEIVSCIYEHFKSNPFNFENFAAAISGMMDSNVVVDQITRHSVDGGRDAIGRYRLGPTTDPVYADFAMEAKCYCPGLKDSSLNTVGVRETSRLIS